MKIKMRDGVALDCHRYGKGQPVVLVHGFGGIQEIWVGQVSWLVAHGYEAIVYDQRNHGASQSIAGSVQVMDLVQDLHDLIIQLHLKKPFLIGHSMGAGVVYGFLGYYPSSKLSGAIGIDQPPKMLSNAEWPYGFLDVTDDNYRTNLLKKRKVHETLNGLDDRIWQRYHPAKKQKPFRLKENLGLLVNEARADWRSALEHTQVDTLLVSSVQSPFFDYRFAETMERLNPQHIHALAVEGAGNDVEAEIPDKFNQIMGAFLKNPATF